MYNSYCSLDVRAYYDSRIQSEWNSTSYIYYFIIDQLEPIVW